MEQSLETSAQSGYERNGVRFIKHPVYIVDYIATLTVDDKTTVFFEIWYLDDRGARHRVDDQSEIDYVVGFTRTLPLGIELEAGIGHIDGAPLFRKQGDMLFLYAKLSKSWQIAEHHELEIFVGVDGYIPYSKSLDGGVVFYGGVKHTWHMTRDDKWSLETTLQANRHDGFFGYKPGGTMTLDMMLRYQKTEHLSFFLGGTVGREDHQTYGIARLGMSYTW